MITVLSRQNTPYIMMHIQGRPDTMQLNPAYADVVGQIHQFFEERITVAAEAGIQDIIIDPGFGFGKTVEHNYRLLACLEQFMSLGRPVMVGLSRKSMINRVLKTSPSEALNGTTVLNTIAILKGAHILRVHDVREASEAVKLCREFIAATSN
jgi:dihydropteroate synthase